MISTFSSMLSSLYEYFTLPECDSMPQQKFNSSIKPKRNANSNEGSPQGSPRSVISPEPFGSQMKHCSVSVKPEMVERGKQTVDLRDLKTKSPIDDFANQIADVYIKCGSQVFQL